MSVWTNRYLDKAAVVTAQRSDKVVATHVFQAKLVPYFCRKRGILVTVAYILCHLEPWTFLVDHFVRGYAMQAIWTIFFGRHTELKGQALFIPAGWSWVVLSAKGNAPPHHSHQSSHMTFEGPLKRHYLTRHVMPGLHQPWDNRACFWRTWDWCYHLPSGCSPQTSWLASG